MSFSRLPHAMNRLSRWTIDLYFCISIIQVQKRRRRRITDESSFIGRYYDFYLLAILFLCLSYKFLVVYGGFNGHKNTETDFAYRMNDDFGYQMSPIDHVRYIFGGILCHSKTYGTHKPHAIPIHQQHNQTIWAIDELHIAWHLFFSFGLDRSPWKTINKLESLCRAIDSGTK